MSFLSDSSHTKQDALPKEDGLKNGDIDVDFSQLKLDDKGQCKEFCALPKNKLQGLKYS